jgi:RNA polymerase sigma-70 factor (ECF subfamily)
MYASLVLGKLLPPTTAMGNSAPTDEALIARVAQRDKRALELLYDRYSSGALGLALKIIGERNEAEEIVQEAFWRVWRRAATYRAARGQFSAWLFGIVHNLAIDELRRRRARPSAMSIDADAETAFEIADDKMDVAESAYQAVEGERVRATLSALPESQRSVIELAYFQGLTHQEIAERLGEPLGTIHTRARLALLKLKELLAL